MTCLPPLFSLGLWASCSGHGIVTTAPHPSRPLSHRKNAVAMIPLFAAPQGHSPPTRTPQVPWPLFPCTAPTPSPPSCCSASVGGGQVTEARSPGCFLSILSSWASRPAPGLSPGQRDLSPGPPQCIIRSPTSGNCPQSPAPLCQLPAFCLGKLWGVCGGCGLGGPNKGSGASGDPRAAATSKQTFTLDRELQGGSGASERLRGSAPARMS